jgi:hypothetical protein
LYGLGAVGAGRYTGTFEGAPVWVDVYCLFGGRVSGSSSSSPLEVRSITAGRDLFPLAMLDSLGMPGESSWSRFPEVCVPVWVLYAFGVPILILSPVLVISTKSSSESLVNPLERGADCDVALTCSSHFPSGWIVT